MSKRPTCALHKCVPPTFAIEVSDVDDLDEALYDVPEVASLAAADKTVWIAKASMTNQGKGIFLFDSRDSLEEQLRRHIEEGSDDEDSDDEDSRDMSMAERMALAQARALLHRQWVLQQYIADPMLIDGRKFHIRIYAVVVGNARIFLCEDALALVSAEKYSESDLENKAAHVTNTHLQMHSNNHANSANIESKCVYSLSRHFADRPEFLQCIMAQMRQCTAEVFECVLHESHAYAPLPHCFEYYGLDFLVDRAGQVHFLEANATPDFAMTGTDLAHIPQQAVRLGVGAAVKLDAGAEDFDNEAELLQLLQDCKATEVLHHRSRLGMVNMTLT
ncbi:MAG: hypothetical protein MHM6MM_003826 [Cercozoa sp. M6MM]